MKIVIVGDSYAHGTGSTDLDKKSWGALLQADYPDIVVKNYSGPGSDNLTVATQLWTNLEEDIDLIFFCATFYQRMQAAGADYTGNEIITMSVSTHFEDFFAGSNDTIKARYNSAVENYYRYLYNVLVGQNYATSAILSGLGCANLVQADFFWSIPTRYFEPIVNPIVDKINPMKFVACCDLDYQRNELASCGHPNDQGYLKYYLEIIKPLFEKYLKERNG